MIIMLFGAPLATSNQRGGAAYGVGVSLGTTVIFLMLVQLTQAVGRKGAGESRNLRRGCRAYCFSWWAGRCSRASARRPDETPAPVAPGSDLTDESSYRQTETFPIVARGSIRFFRRMSRATIGTFRGVGKRVLFLRDIRRALREPKTYLPLVIPQMKAIGVDSVPLAIMVAAFIGGVISMQVRYQLFQGIQLSIVGLSVRQIVILETGPLLTGLVLAGRVGAKMTAEIGTMRVTEQIDALETLAYDPVAYLVVPRIIAAIVMLPILVVFADVAGVVAGHARRGARDRCADVAVHGGRPPGIR